MTAVDRAPGEAAARRYLSSRNDRALARAYMRAGRDSALLWLLPIVVASMAAGAWLAIATDRCAP